MKLTITPMTKEEGQIFISMAKNYKKWQTKEEIMSDCHFNEGDFNSTINRIIDEKRVKVKGEDMYKLTHKGRNAVGIYSSYDKLRSGAEKNKAIITIVSAILAIAVSLLIWLLS